MRRCTKLLASMVLAAFATTAQAASGTVEMRLRALESRLPDADRLAAIEKTTGGQGVGILAADVEQLKSDIRDLRGLVEQLTHQQQQQLESQRQLYSDIDKRLQALESRLASYPAAAETGPNLPATIAQADGSANPGQEQADYLAAFQLLQQGKTQEAILAFQDFLGRYPESQYTANARYWLGEAHYLGKDYSQALAEFQKLLVQHPDSQKTGGALLKIGYIYYETKNFVEARTTLEKVKSNFPHTNVGTLAAERLARMKKEGV